MDRTEALEKFCREAMDFNDWLTSAGITEEGVIGLRFAKSIIAEQLKSNQGRMMKTIDVTKCSMNKLGNSQNPWQGDRKKVFCCCSAGLLRSPTMAHTLNLKFGYNTRACGLEPEYALIPCTETLIYWADEIVVMDKTQSLQIEQIVRDMPEFAKEKAQATEIKILEIEDSYGYMDAELQRLILEAYHVN